MCNNIYYIPEWSYIEKRKEKRINKEEKPTPVMPIRV